jgi:Ca2+-binding RTX toxin-like protein
VRHKELNKDEGTINPVTGAATAGTTIRGRVGTNFANAVGLAIADTRRQWADLRAEIIRLNGPKRGNLMTCALTPDDPVKDCQRRKLAIEVDVGSRGAGGPYAVELVESGVDLLGTRRADRLRCGAGITFVAGAAGADRITCGAGNDMISGGRGADTIAAGGGDDIILVGARDGHRGTERVSGGPGNDIVEFEAGRRRTVSMPNGRRAVITSGRARFELRGVEVVLFGYRR